ncbi:hypothetical protein HYH03_000935 [Edaphochlamys debaryana]|uniref:3-beta hydroxysteroid dehydrogenase/isomerase domain-containing protein n=1 Tax=Edaphochlamys debaryana TaxID=47281 RepID=A0A836C6V4_9CHLO|nr:hypothetical protein HYH03_000935 [Edaphochlamys debaryana]|eukprot:KAG2501117.1 hypothetical protein HYH03_000935 [Edaphochlamys debaryana]
METWIMVGALGAAVAIKLAFFYVYTKQGAKNDPIGQKKRAAVPFEVVQKGAEKDGKHICVTGGCGFLGSSIVRQLYDAVGPRVSIVVLDAAIHEHFGSLVPGVTYIKGDVSAISHVHAALAGCDLVIHSAGLVGNVTTKAADYNKVNELGTRNVVETCLELDVKNLVYTSSLSVAFPLSSARRSGHGGSRTPIPESAKPVPDEDLNGDYARSKAAAERLVVAANCHVLHTVVLRPGGVYGAKDPHLIPVIFQGTPYIGDGNVVVPFVWVEDAAAAHVKAAQIMLGLAPPPASAGQDRLHGRVFHLNHDVGTDPFLYAEMGGGPLQPGAAGPKAASVLAKEKAAGLPETLPPGVNAYGMKCNGGSPLGIVMALADLNKLAVRWLGMPLLDVGCHPQNITFASNNWIGDITQARRMLGWEPTPWRVVAARLGEEAAEAGNKRWQGFDVGVAAPPAGKAKRA